MCSANYLGPYSWTGFRFAFTRLDFVLNLTSKWNDGCDGDGHGYGGDDEASTANSVKVKLSTANSVKATITSMYRPTATFGTKTKSEAFMIVFFMHV